MPQRIAVVDAFAARPFSGNPAAVLVLDRPADDSWMLSVASEMNLSETAFLTPEDGGIYHLRWFTPRVEVDLCGHATLASAHVLWEDSLLARDAVARFRTRSGILSATTADGWITLDFPRTPVEAEVDPAALAEALGVAVVRAGRTRFDVLAEVESEASVRSIVPDLARLGAIPSRGIIVTAPAEDDGVDFVSRFFAPGVGILEDPVTGSAHCALGPYWAGRLGKSELVAFQASSRGGVVRVGVDPDRVRLGGRAVTVLRGELAGGSGPDPSS